MDLDEMMAKFDVEYILLDAYLHGDLESSHPEFRRRLESYLTSHEQDITRLLSPSCGQLVLLDLRSPRGP